MLKIPHKSEFPGTGQNGNGIQEVMKTQPYWIDTVKNSCQSCHALGSKGIRTIPTALGPVREFSRGVDAPASSRAGEQQHGRDPRPARPQEGAGACSRTGPTASPPGELPFAKPERPQGVERNVVISMWDWSTPKAYLHDAISTDKRNPRVNANGLIYGSPEESTDMVPVLDPHHEHGDAGEASLSRSEDAVFDRLCRAGRSPYWGDEPIWDGHTSIHNPIIDDKGASGSPRGSGRRQNPDYCKAGSDHPSAKVAPLERLGASALDVRSEDRQVVADRHLLHHAASVFRQGRQQHAVDQRRQPGRAASSAG